MNIIEQKIIAELFNPASYQHFNIDNKRDFYLFRIDDLMYLVRVKLSGSDIDGREIYKLDFGIKDADEFMEDGGSTERFNFVQMLNKVDATDVVETVIEIVIDHYENISGGSAVYDASPVVDYSGGKQMNRRLELYQRQANRAASNRNIDGNVEIKSGKSEYQQSVGGPDDKVYFVFN